MPEIILGIDLGTTNSEVAIVQDGKSVVLEDETGDPILPSFVGLGEDVGVEDRLSRASGRPQPRG